MYFPSLKIIITLFIFGLSFGCGPCLASCGPIFIAYSVGTKKGFLKTFISYVLFSLSRISVYILLSILIFILGDLAAERVFGRYGAYLAVLGGIFIALVGFFMILGKASKLNFFVPLERCFLGYDKKNIIVMGFAAGLLPCAPLIAVLSYIGLVSRSWFHSLLYSGIFGLGTFFSPLIFLAVFSGAVSEFFSRKKQLYSRLSNIICGLVIIICGMQLIIHGYTRIF